MKKDIVGFYSTLLRYLRINSEIESDGLIPEILALAEGASPSWEATGESVRFLEQCTNRPSSIEDDEEWNTMLNDFVKNAFRDLSVLKNPAAMDVFVKVARAVSPTFNNGEDMLVWAKSVKERPDGSGVLVLHVSDLKRFRKEIEGHNFVDGSTTLHALEEGVMLGS